MTMAMTEAPFSLTIKVGPNNDLLTGRAETAEEMQQRVADLRSIAASMQGGTQPVAEPTIEQAVQNLQDAGMVAQPAPTPAPAATGEIQQQQDQWGNMFTLGVPDAGTCQHGARIVKNGTNRQGKNYKAYVCVNDSPFRQGKYDKTQICEIAWPKR